MIVDDLAEAEQGSGRMHRTEFLDRLRSSSCAAVDQALVAAGMSTDGCPYLEVAFRFARRLSAQDLERRIRLATTGDRSVQGAQDYIDSLTELAATKANEWVRTGQLAGLPPGLPSPRVLGVTTDALSSVGVQFKHEEGHATTSVGPAWIQSRLGPGQPLDNRVEHSMSAAFGQSFAGTRVHDDPVANDLASSHAARAFTIGQHIAFGAGQYRPGTVYGDALIAHELAHVTQQRQASSSADVSRGQRIRQPDHGAREDALEADADRSAVDAVAHAWSGGRSRRPGPGSRPRLTSALRLQRCDEIGFHWITHHDVDADRMNELVAEHALRLTADPEPSVDQPALVGQEIIFDAEGSFVDGERPSLNITGWEVTTPDGDSATYYPRPISPLEYRVRQSGSYRVRMFASIIDEDHDAWRVHVDRNFEAITPEARAQLLLPTEVDEFERFMSGQEAMRGLLRPGDQDAAAGDFVIRTSAANPEPIVGEDAPGLRYRISRRAGSGIARFHWYATPMNWEGMPDVLGRYQKTTVAGAPTYDLGEGDAATLPATWANIFVVRCVVHDGAQTEIDQVNYLQTILDEEGIEDLEEFEEQMDRSHRFYNRLQEGQRLALPAVHVATETGVQTQLNLFLGRQPDSDEQVMLDLTPGLDPSEHTIEYVGDNTRAVMGHFDRRNKYPEGAVNIRVPRNGHGFETGRWEFETEGASLAGIWSGRFGIGAMILGLLGLALAPFTEGGSLVVTVLVVGSAAAGITSGVLSLADRFQNETVSGTGVAIDVASIAASFVGGAAAVRAARQGAAVLVAGRTTRYLLWTSFGLEALSGLLISVDGMAQINQILDSGMSDEEKQAAIARIVANLIVTGGLLAISSRDLSDTNARIRGGLGSEAETGLSVQTRLTLSHMFDDETLRALRGLSNDDVERLAGIIRTDPSIVARLPADRRQLRAAIEAGVDSPSALDYALMQTRLTSSGVPRAQAQRLTTALRTAGVPNTILGQVDDALLDTLRRIDSALESGDFTAAIRAGDTLPTSVVDASARSRLEESLAAAHGRTSPGFYRNPEATLPGGTTVAPTATGGRRYHGTSDLEPSEVFESGLAGRGPNTDIQQHVDGAADSAFRGTTQFPLSPDGEGGAGYWAGEGGWVFEIDGTPSWDANQLLEGRVATPGGFTGNRARGEMEHLIPGHVPRERIRGAYPVREGRGTRVRLGEFVPNPNYVPPR